MPRCRDCGGEANRVLLCARRHDRESLAVVRPTSSRDRGGRATDATGSPRGAGSSPELPAGMVAEEGPSVQGGAGGKSAGAPGAGSLQSREPPAARTSVPREEHGPPASSTSRVDSKRASLKISSCIERNARPRRRTKRCNPGRGGVPRPVASGQHAVELDDLPCVDGLDERGSVDGIPEGRAVATDQVVELPVRAEGLAEGPQAPSKGSTPGGPEALGVLPPQAPGQGAPAGGSPGTACGRGRG